MICTLLTSGILDRLDRLFDLFHADAVVLDLARLHQVIQHVEDFRVVVDLGGRAVQLHQVEGFHIQVSQAALDESGQILAVVAFGDMRVEAATGFGSDVDFVRRAP